MGLAKTLPCPMLLGIDWLHMEEVVTQILVKKAGEWEDPGAACFRTPEEGEKDLDVEQIIGDEYF